MSQCNNEKTAIKNDAFVIFDVFIKLIFDLIFKQNHGKKKIRFNAYIWR